MIGTSPGTRDSMAKSPGTPMPSPMRDFCASSAGEGRMTPVPDDTCEYSPGASSCRNGPHASRARSTKKKRMSLKKECVETINMTLKRRIWKQMYDGKFVNGWTEIMNKKLMEILKPSCILAFRTRRVKKTASRKLGGPFFSAHMRCKIPGCHTFQLIMPEDPKESQSKELSMVVLKYGMPRHGEFFSHRRLAGKRRRSAAKLVNVRGAYSARGAMLDKAPERELRDGNLTKAPPSQVLRQAAYEMRKSERHSHYWCEDIHVTKNISREEDLTSKKVPGGVHLVGRDPLAVHMYREHFFTKFAAQPSTIHIDATGGVTKKMGNKRPLLYAVLAKEGDKTSYPMGLMLSESHSSPTISHFLGMMARDFKIATGLQFKPKRIVSDFSWAVIHAASEGILKCDLLTYLDRCWRHQRGDCQAPETVLSLCCAHVSQQLSRELKKKSLSTDARHAYMWLFAKAQQATSLEELSRLFCTICKLALSPKEVTSLDLSFPVPKRHAEEDDNAELQPVKEKFTYRTNTKFGRHFDALRAKVQKEIDEQKAHGSAAKNIFYCPDIIKYVLSTLMPLAPLWTQMQAKNVTSNACVESFMRIVKKETLRGRRRLNPGDFVRVMLADMARRIKHDCVPPKKIRKAPKRKRTHTPSDDDLEEEAWNKRGKSITKNRTYLNQVKPPSELQHLMADKDTEHKVDHPAMPSSAPDHDESPKCDVQEIGTTEKVPPKAHVVDHEKPEASLSHDSPKK